MTVRPEHVEDVQIALARAREKRDAVQARLDELNRPAATTPACCPVKLRAFLQACRRAVRQSAEPRRPGLCALVLEVLVGFVATFRMADNKHVPATLTVELPGWLAQLAGTASRSGKLCITVTLD